SPITRPPPTLTSFPYTTLFRSSRDAPEKRSVAAASQPVGRDRAPRRAVPVEGERRVGVRRVARNPDGPDVVRGERRDPVELAARDRKSTRLNSSHGSISYAVFC